MFMYSERNLIQIEPDADLLVMHRFLRALLDGDTPDAPLSPAHYATVYRTMLMVDDELVWRMALHGDLDCLYCFPSIPE